MATINATISWNASTGATSYPLERKVDGGNFGQISDQAATSFVDQNLILGSTYTYRVAAKNSYGVSAWSNEASVTVGNVPPVPGGLTVVLTVVP